LILPPDVDKLGAAEAGAEQRRWTGGRAMKRRAFLRGAVAAAALSGSPVAALERVLAATAPMGPLLTKWGGPYGGIPPFDVVKATDIKPGLMKGMDLLRAEIKLIAMNRATPTFENTIARLEDAGRPFGQAQNFFGIYTSTMNDKAMRAVEAEMSPVLAAFYDEITQNEPLFKRIKAVYEVRGDAGLNSEQQRLVDVVYTRFARQGANLDRAQKAQLVKINRRLATLFTTFSQNQLADEENMTMVLESEADVAGLADDLRAGAAAAAEAHGQKGKWLLTNTRSSVEPFLTFSTRRDLRERAWRMWSRRGDNANEHNNKATITEIVRLRTQRAQLLGYPSHAHWILADNMAKTPEGAMALMTRVWKAAVARAHEEVEEMRKVADAEGAKISIEPWDYRFYAEKVRRAKYDIDEGQVKEYLQLDKIREGMFWAAGQVYGLEFAKLDGVPVYHQDMTVYEVRRDGTRVGLWYFDPYARAGKSSGAWMSEYRTQERFHEATTPIVSNNANFIPGRAGKPVLISWDDASTMFHEFGHALHGLLSNVTYPTLAGTNVKRDFVEMPSQVNERWLMTDEVLDRFALHYQTGKPIPKELVEKIRKAKTFNQGFKTVEYLASAIYDMKLHTMTDPAATIDPGEFEAKTMTEIGCPKEIIMRHRPTAFGHIFADDGYSAGYYVYIWADTMSADVSEAFVEAGGFYDKPTCRRLSETIFSVGNSVAPDVAFRNFRGREVDTSALMRDRGFPVT
jgi:peptidyl-dipeptidase Dcp